MAKVKETKSEKDKKIKEGFISGTGRRKTAVARVFLYKGEGDFVINDKTISEYFSSEKDQVLWMRPFHAVGVANPTDQYSASVKIHGSGKSAQLGALVHGFSRALAEIDEDFSVILRKQGFLTRDSRMVERKKPWFRKARKKPQFSKR